MTWRAASGPSASRSVPGRALGAAILCIVPACTEVLADNPRTGRAFVFSGATGALIRTLDAPDPQHKARFGLSVAGLADVDGDAVPELAVAAPGVDGPSARKAGRLYVFSGATGALLRAIGAPTPAPRSRFGWAIAPAGDVDGDGAGDVVVGEPRGPAPTGEREGRAWILSGADGSVLSSLASSSGAEGGLFGWSVAAGGDSDGDGFAEILVGAPGERDGARRDQGRAYLFGMGGSLLATFEDPQPQAGARFGASLGFMSDADGDGFDEVLVGADGQHVNPGDFAGKVFVLQSVDPSDVLVAERTAPAPSTQANFGFAVAGLADVDGDGRGDLAASAPDQDTTAPTAGAAFTLSGDPALVARTDYLLAVLEDPDPRPVALLGGSMAALSDVTGDLLPEIAIGAELQRDPAGVRTGLVYVFEASSGALVHVLESPTGDSCARFGWSVAPAGDLDGDAVGDVLVGAPLHRTTPRRFHRTCF